MRRFLAPVFALTALVLAPVPVSAQQTEIVVWGQHSAWLNINNETKFLIRTLDEVKDGCWTNAAAAKNAVAIELQRSGYKVDVSEDDVLNNMIWLEAFGYETKNFVCIVSYRLVLHIMDMSSRFYDKKHEVISIHGPEMWRRGGIMSGPKSDMSQRIKDAFVEFAQQFLLDIPKKRREVLQAVREAAEKDKDTQPEAYRYWMQFPE